MRHETTRPVPARPAAGHTLAELLVAMAISSLLMAGLSSTLFIAWRANHPVGTTAAILDTSAPLQQLLAELAEAESFSERTPTSVTFSVADRNGDAVAETIRYVWAGTAGDPLRRQENGGPEVKVLGGVQELNLGYDVVHRPEQPPAPLVESGESLVLDQNSSNSGSGSNYGVTNSNWVGGYFLPNLPAVALHWKATRVAVMASPQNPANGGVAVQLCEARVTGLPTYNLIAQGALVESTLPSNDWVEVTYSDASGLDPNAPLCVVVSYEHGTSDAARIKRGTGSGGSPDTHLVTSSDGGETWSVVATNDLWVRVWGTYTSEGPLPTPIDHYHVRAVTAGLRTGADSGTLLEGAVDLWNRPEVAGP